MSVVGEILTASNFLKSTFSPDTCKKDMKKHIRLLKKVVCYHQGELAQYSFLAGEKHKNMKNELNKEKPDKQTLAAYRDELEKHLNEGFLKVVKESFGYIKSYFEERAKREPRVCLKVENDGTIIDLFREKDQLYRKDCKIEENTGFFLVQKTGEWFLCNDIPNEAKNNRYKNPRLDMHEATVNYLKPRLSWVHQKMGKEDKRWIACWEKISINGGNSVPLPEQCYKSTLIVPLTLFGNTLSREFRDKFRITTIPERAIYGFLCVDHHHTNYFREDIDRKVLYIFADLLSLYHITNLTYREYSQTDEKVKVFLEK